MKVNNNKTVVIVAECWNGARLAGRFAARNLYDYSTRIILLHSYKRPTTGIMMLKDITPILKQIAEEELLSLKKELVEEMKLSGDSIESLVIEGDLKSVMRFVLDKYSNLSVVLGTGTDNKSLTGTCKKIISNVIKSRSVPVFMVSDFITIVEESRITVIAENENKINKAYLNFLRNISGKKNSGIELIASDNGNKVNIDMKTASHFAINNHCEAEPRTSIEQVLASRLMPVNTT